MAATLMMASTSRRNWAHFEVELPHRQAERQPLSQGGAGPVALDTEDFSIFNDSSSCSIGQCQAAYDSGAIPPLARIGEVVLAARLRHARRRHAT